MTDPRNLSRHRPARTCGVVLLSFFAGCTAVVPPPAPPTPAAATAAVQRVAYHPDEHEPGPPPTSLPEAPPPAETAPAPQPFTDAKELSVERLVQEVLARNPSLAQMVAAWEAASARYPQEVSLEDPMFETTLGPASFTSSKVNPAYRFFVSQQIPFPGKRRLRGEAAQAEASAAGHDVADMRLQLAESARDAFYEYFLVARALEVNTEGLRLLEEFRSNAETRYKNGLVTQQDVLQAEVEIGRQREQRLRLERMRTVAVARIDTLLNLPPDSPLPPPPAEVTVAGPVPDAVALRAQAVAQRPDLQALQSNIAAEQARLELAHKNFYPDFGPFAMYDRFMGNNPESQDLAPMVGWSMNLPVYRAKRCAAVTEAQARLTRRRAELAQRTNEVNFQVQEAHAQVRESERAVELYQKTILTAAAANIQAAQAAYVTGRIPFLSLIEAQRNLVSLRDRYYETVADYHRRRARLERVVGGSW